MVVSRVSQLAPALGAAATAGVAAAAWPWTVDDAWVTARYARRILAGEGYTFVDGPPTDGVTGPLGLVPDLLGEALAGDPMLGAKLAGGIAAALGVALVIRRAGRESARHAVVTAVLVALWPLVGIWSVAGLETGLATLAACGVAVALVEGRAVGLGLAVAAMAWLRPEAAPACAVALALFSREHGRRSAPAWALAVTGALAVVAFRLALFGQPLPLSAAAKPADLGHGLEYTARAFLVVLGVFGALPVFFAVRAPGPRRGLAFVLGVHVLAVVLAGGDWMPGFRLFVPWLPALALVMAGPIAERLEPGARARRVGAVALAVGAVAVPAFAGALALLDARAGGAARDAAGAELAAYLRATSQRVALVDVGYLGFASDRDLVDLGGITDPVIGRLAGGHVDKAIDPGLLLERDPDTIVLCSRIPPVVDEQGHLQRFAGHPVEGRVAAMPWVRAQMRVTRVEPYAPGVWYVVLSR
ncbi:MAG: hypothetical protein H6719_03120 [Sandaracinaceae bacterium]|nr:hypothetical protein [Sandaracinaceae bacterium]